ncbi:IclR family transcriptional regulator domain-containing protein [Roseomonas xinghualingensis]|uniref:IclR family transcriptional regulator domain-containing protein n=1 Tax=Roseomonas xinghualingensis TaxID=2986475 RepID=UPI0021F1DB1F|nr:IclR family transcriptional regulator C-terminal domain-containing protein [Roseomonas sp. SXEYE001]MCV4210227.1 helix-turn-helix domain-containing protein [Roseomonas sp. SXEYE001]
MTEAGGERREAMAGLAKGLAILECFGEGAPRLTLAEAARRTGLSRATARRCLLTLLELGYVTHDGRHFAPQPRMLRLGYSFLSATPLPRLAQPVLEAIQAAAGEAISLAILDGVDTVFVARAAPHRMVSVGPGIGSRLPAWCSATGRVLLASLSADAIASRLAASSFEPLTHRTAAAPDEVRARIERARAAGYAACDEELELGLLSLAVPVRDLSGGVVAAMSVSTQPSRRSLEEAERDLLPLLLEGARRLSANL